MWCEALYNFFVQGYQDNLLRHYNGVFGGQATDMRQPTGSITLSFVTVVAHTGLGAAKLSSPCLKLSTGTRDKRCNRTVGRTISCLPLPLL